MVSRGPIVVRLLVVLTLAFALRAGAGFWWQSRLPPGKSFYFGDSETYWVLGRAVAECGPFRYPPNDALVMRTPGYPVLLSPIFSLWGDEADVWLGRLESAWLGSLGVLGAFGLAAIFLGSNRALRAAWLAALYPGFVAMGAFVLSEAPFVALMAAQLGFWIMALRVGKRSRRVTWALGAGIWGAAATLVRPSWLLFTPFAVGIGLLVGRKGRPLAITGLIAMLTLSAAMLPWWIRNYRVTGHFVPTTLQVGASLYDGLNPEATGASDMRPVDRLSEFLRADYAKQGLDPAEKEWRLNRDLTRAALSWAWQNPVRVARLAGIKLLRLWSPVPNHADFSSLPARLAIALTFLPLLVAGAWGLSRLCDADISAHLLWLPALYFTLLHCIFVSSLRYREPAMLGLIVAAAAVGWKRNQGDASEDRHEERPPAKKPTSKTLSRTVLLALVIVGLGWGWKKVDQYLAAEVRGKLAQLFPEAEIGIDSTGLAGISRLRARHVSLRKKDSQNGCRVEIDEAHVVCDWNLSRLLRGEMEIHEVILRRPLLSLVIEPDGRWHWEHLVPNRPERRLVTARIEDATLLIRDWRRGKDAEPLSIEHVSMTITPIQTKLQDERGANSPSPLFDIQGEFHCPLARQARFQGQVTGDGRVVSLSGGSAGIAWGPQLCQGISCVSGKSLAELGQMQAEVAVQFTLDYDAGRVDPLAFRLQGKVAEGRWSHRELGLALSDIRGELAADQDGFEWKNVAAKFGSASCAMHVQGRGWSPNGLLTVQLDVRDLAVDQRLLGRLAKTDARWEQIQDDYSPTGLMDISLQVERRQGQWARRAEAAVRQASFTYHGFRYPLERGEGKMTFEAGRLHIDLRARAADRDVGIQADIINLTERPEFTVTISGKQLPIDERLMTALQPSHRRVLDELNLKGRFDLSATFQRSAQTNHEVKKELLFSAADARLMYRGFPYQLPRVRGELLIRDDEWMFGPREPITATNGTATVQCTGVLAPGPNGTELNLRLDAQQVSLDDELLHALPTQCREPWNRIRPRGNVRISCRVQHSQSTGQTTKFIEITPANPNESDVSIWPTFLPLRLEGVQGTLIVDGNRLHSDAMWAHHGRTKVASGLDVTLDPAGGWNVSLPNFRLEWTDEDAELIHSLPPALRDPLRQLDPNGSVVVAGVMAFSGDADPRVPVASRWNVNVDLARGSLNCGTRLDNLWGGLRQFQGTARGGQFSAAGELAMDSVYFQRQQFTNLTGPFVMDGRRVVIGADLRQRPHASQRHVSGQVCGGTVRGDAEIILGTPPRITLAASLSDANLREVAREYLADDSPLRGKLGATIQLQSVGNGVQGLLGQGTVAIRQADVYELPIMVSLLNVLNLKAPEAAAFSDGDAEFHIENGRIRLDQVGISGDLVSLVGQGHVGFDSSIDLTLGAMVGRRDVPIPIVSDIWRGVRGAIGAANKQILPLRVTGTMHNPVASVEPFPEFFEAMQRLQGDLRGGTEEALSGGAARNWFKRRPRR